MFTSKWIAAVVVAGALFAGRGLAAQGPAENPLPGVKALACTFSTYVIGNWKGGQAVADVKPSSLKLQFTAIDHQEATAEMSGTFGPSHIIARLSGGTLHFMAIDNGGPLYVTTIFFDRTNPAKLKAVHSRHEFTEVSLPGFTSRPEQYYGECQVVK